MYFTWEEFPLIPPTGLNGQHCPVVVIGAGPVGLATALGLVRNGVRCVVLEARTTISKGSRALAMNRRSMQILDQLGVGQAVMEKGLTWSAGWTFYGKHLVHSMDIASPPNEKHGQTNLQQCWMEQLLLDELKTSKLAEVRYGHEVTALDCGAEEVSLEVKTAAGGYSLKADYLVAADGPRSLVRRSLGMAYEGTSYSQRFVINDIICREPLPDGRRLFFSPPYLPGKTVLMHKAPFDMWRLDFQLLDEQDAEAEMQPEKVHERIRAHFELMGIAPNYELALTSVYKANAVSLASYNTGRVVFVGDAAHQVPIFGGRGVNHGYEDAHNLAWKLALVVKGQAPETLLDSYTQERRGAILATLADLTRTTIFITTPSDGVALVREAVLSLSVDESFVANLFDPYASAPYDCTDSALNTATADVWSGLRCRPGALVPDAVLDADGTRLYDRFAAGFTVLRFSSGSLASAAIADEAMKKALATIASDMPITLLSLPVSGEVGKLFDASCGCTYLLRPDNRVVARWRQVGTEALLQAVRHATANTTGLQTPLPKNVVEEIL